MVKVNNGWQSNSIDEVESLASQAGSPTSSTSTLHGRRNLITPPRVALANAQDYSNLQMNTIIPAPMAADFDLYSRSEPQSGTYESFWRSHSTAPTYRPSHISSPVMKAPLAPPADIRPQIGSRRSNTPKFSKPPTIPGQGSGLSMPHTPNRSDLSMDGKLQSASQKTIQEQDAIETLLFMSSPGNSGNMGHQFPPRTSQASPQASPLRTEFTGLRGAHGRKVGFAGKSIASTAYPQRSKMGISSAKRKGDAIDKLLDEMADTSSDEEELVLNYSSPRRIAAGRV